MGTCGRRAAIAAALVLVAWSGACSAPPAPPVPPTANPASASIPAVGPVGIGDRALCFGRYPAGWAAAAHTVPTDPALGITVDAVAGSMVYGQYSTVDGSGVGAVNLTSGALTRISPLSADAGGVGWMSVEPPWLVWEQLDSSHELRQWSLYAWNQSTGHTTRLATSTQPDGSLVAGAQPRPMLRHGRVAWAQPVPGKDSSQSRAEVRVVDLGTGHTSVVASGEVASPVYAGPYLVWATRAGPDQFSLRSVDADSLRPRPLPAQAGTPSSVSQLAGSPDYLAWGSQDYTNVTIWRVGTNQHDHYLSRDGRHFFQFMQFAGQFLVWFAAGASSVLDLTTGMAFDVPGTVTGSAKAIILTTPMGSATKSGPTPTRVSWVPTASAPPVTACV